MKEGRVLSVLDKPVARVKIRFASPGQERTAGTLRVISGSLKGKRLFSAAGLSLRPTSDRVRESIFDILQGEIEGRRVLDLFAGTGAMGIEALSRGASGAVFIESHRSSLEALRRNLRDCRLEASSAVLDREVEAGLRVLEERGETFEIVFLDPPYDRGLARKTVERISASPILKPGALVVAEHSLTEEMEVRDPLARVDLRKYGRTRVSFLRKAG